MIIAAAATAAPLIKGAAETAKNIGQSVGGALGLTDTAEDRKRKEVTQQKLNAALVGDENALNYLLNRAFERRTEDGKFPPRAVINLSRDALRKYYRATGIYPPAQYADQLGINVPAGTAERVIQTITQPISQGVGSAAVDAAADRIGEQARAKAPAFVLVAVASAIALAAVVYFAARSAK